MDRLQKAYQLLELNELDEAMRTCSDELNDNPHNPVALFMAAMACQRAERHGVAYNLLLRAGDISPHREQVWNNIGLSAVKMQRFDEAKKFLTHALEINPECYPAINNLALLHVYDCDPLKAIEYCDKSLAHDSTQWDVQETRAYACLQMGNYRDGWQFYEHMIGKSPHRAWKPIKEHLPRWDGSKGKVVHVRGEQGIGDEIAFASCLPDAQKNAYVVLECDHMLEGLFKRSFPDIAVHGTRFKGERDWGDKYPLDASILIGSLCTLYRNDKSEFPGTPFLVADPERRVQWRALFDTLPGKKVGIAWTGGKKDTHAARRSLQLEQLVPLLKTPGISWVSLQYKDPTEEINSLWNKHGIKVHHWARGAESRDYDDVAGMVAELDLVITVTTAAVDLCGGLGKPCWVFVPNKPHWRYAGTGEDKCWYKSVRLFRQTEEWSSVIERVANELASFHWDGQSSTAGVHGPAVLDHRPVLSTGLDQPASYLATPGYQTRTDGVYVYPVSASVAV